MYVRTCLSVWFENHRSRNLLLPDLKPENVAFQINEDGSVSVRIFDSCYHPDTVSDGDECDNNEFRSTAKSHLQGIVVATRLLRNLLIH